MKAFHYELWFYDVWGNAKDGFEVNDRSCSNRDFVILSNPKTYNRGKTGQFTAFNPTDQQVLQALVKAGELKESALTADIEIEGDGENMYLVDIDAGYCPLCELILKEDQTNYNQ